MALRDKETPNQTLFCMLVPVKVVGHLVTPCPLVPLVSSSTVADAYRFINHTVDNKTKIEDGYYYLNNFDNILNSFGERVLEGTPSLGLAQGCVRPLCFL